MTETKTAKTEDFATVFGVVSIAEAQDAEVCTSRVNGVKLGLNLRFDALKDGKEAVISLYVTSAAVEEAARALGLLGGEGR